MCRERSKGVHQVVEGYDEDVGEKGSVLGDVEKLRNVPGYCKSCGNQISKDILDPHLD